MPFSKVNLKKVEVEVVQDFLNFIRRRTMKAISIVRGCGRKDEDFKKFKERSAPIIKDSGS